MKYGCTEHGELQEIPEEEPLCVECLGEAMTKWLKVKDNKPAVDDDGMLCIPVEVVEQSRAHIISFELFELIRELSDIDSAISAHISDIEPYEQTREFQHWKVSREQLFKYQHRRKEIEKKISELKKQ
jgi:hypothetical protein